MITLQYHEIFFSLTAPRCPGMAAGAVSLRKSHVIVILSFCTIVKGQAKYIDRITHIILFFSTPFKPHASRWDVFWTQSFSKLVKFSRAVF